MEKRQKLVILQAKNLLIYSYFLQCTNACSLSPDPPPPPIQGKLTEIEPFHGLFEFRHDMHY